MNVKVKIELCASVKQKDKKEMYGAAEFLTADVVEFDISFLPFSEL